MWFKPLMCYYRKFLQLDKFTLPPSFGEINSTVQEKKNNTLTAPQYNHRIYEVINN